MISPTVIRKLQLILEEIVLQSIVPHLDGLASGYPIRAVIEYSEASESSSFTLRYGGDGFDPMQSGDPLTVMLVRGIASKTLHAFDKENCLSIEIGQGR